jgi:hypothetical protein
VSCSENLPNAFQFCGPNGVTGETMFHLESVGSIAEIRSLLGKHFHWELTRAGATLAPVPSQLNFMRMNCWGPDREGPIKGAWPISTVDVYQQWYDSLLAGSWKHGQFARIQVVALTDQMLFRDQQQYRDYLQLDENPVPYWFAPLLEEMDGTQWLFDKPMGDAADSTEWGGEKLVEENGQ